jgi:hypothetical protein
MMSRARAWMAKPPMRRVRRPKRSTVKVLTRTMRSWRTDWIPLMARAWWPAFQPRDL